MRVVYLHGFASSPASSKAMFLERQFTRAGIPFYCPNLNEPDFSTLTTSRMVEQVVNLIDGLGAGRVVLFGSSLGAFVALCVANRAPPQYVMLLTHLSYSLRLLILVSGLSATSVLRA